MPLHHNSATYTIQQITDNCKYFIFSKMASDRLHTGPILKLRHFRDALRLSRTKNIKKSQGANRICPWLFFMFLLARSLSDYLRVTFAPSASSLALASSAEALSSCSLSPFGAPSTASLASLSPRPVISRTTLITLTLFAPRL